MSRLAIAGSEGEGRGARRSRRASASLLGIGLLVLAAAGCAPKQVVPVDVIPAPSQVYLDKKPLDALPNELVLRADRDHTLFFKREGYRSELVVLETRKIDGEERLVPERVELRLRLLTSGTRDLEVELEADGG
jgi:hypothetical protein